MFSKRPSAEQLEEHGLVWEDVAAEYQCNVWPCNLDAYNVFSRAVSQWRTSGNTPIGIDYNVLPFLFDLVEAPTEKRLELFDKVRVMEDAALSLIREQHQEYLEKSK